MEYKTFSISENHYLLQIGYFDTQVTIWNMVIICMDFSGVRNDGIGWNNYPKSIVIEEVTLGEYQYLIITVQCMKI